LVTEEEELEEEDDGEEEVEEEAMDFYRQNGVERNTQWNRMEVKSVTRCSSKTSQPHLFVFTCEDEEKNKTSHSLL